MCQLSYQIQLIITEILLFEILCIPCAGQQLAFFGSQLNSLRSALWLCICCFTSLIAFCSPLLVLGLGIEMFYAWDSLVWIPSSIPIEWGFLSCSSVRCSCWCGDHGHGVSDIIFSVSLSGLLLTGPSCFSVWSKLFPLANKPLREVGGVS